jgi:hypothetical protein
MWCLTASGDDFIATSTVAGSAGRASTVSDGRSLSAVVSEAKLVIGLCPIERRERVWEPASADTSVSLL